MKTLSSNASARQKRIPASKGNIVWGSSVVKFKALLWNIVRRCHSPHTALPSCHTVCYADGTLVEETIERTRSLKQTEAWLCHQFCKGIRLGSLAAQKIESMFIHGSRGASFPTHITMGAARVTMGSTLISGPRAGC